mgnify:CR=1 FL=1
MTTSGNWEITVEPLIDGDYEITAEQEYLAGNISPLSGVLPITIDATAPRDGSTCTRYHRFSMTDDLSSAINP